MGFCIAFALRAGDPRRNELSQVETEVCHIWLSLCVELRCQGTNVLYEAGPFAEEQSVALPVHAVRTSADAPRTITNRGEAELCPALSTKAASLVPHKSRLYLIGAL